MMKCLLVVVGSLSLVIPALVGEEPVDIEKYRQQAVEKWENDIKKLEALDSEEVHPADGILFVGSSSIRRWSTIAEDMAPYHPIRRGFGGSRFSDLAIFADRIISPHTFRAVVIFVANDISGKENDKTPEEVVRLFTYFHSRIRQHDPNAPIFYIAVTPTEKRVEVWPKAKAANSAIRARCKDMANTFFIGTESIYLDAEGKPRPELFVDDKLHLNELGYDLWAAAIKSHLDSVLNGVQVKKAP